jgi:hypothetical protein
MKDWEKTEEDLNKQNWNEKFHIYRKTSQIVKYTKAVKHLLSPSYSLNIGIGLAEQQWIIKQKKEPDIL